MFILQVGSSFSVEKIVNARELHSTIHPLLGYLGKEQKLQQKLYSGREVKNKDSKNDEKGNKEKGSFS